ncbi:MAG: sigma-70 family RNA polymerase sigma factor [Planctomycetes bacterium]|nr:sigma-70 family RNA polymerase sigma factor [Planctomycetota bacterium]
MSADEQKPEPTNPDEKAAKAPVAGEFQLPEGFENDQTAILVTRAKNGDAGALNDLFTRYNQLMVEVARRRIGPRLRLKEDPDDLAQTTFREATRDFHNYEYRGEGSLVRWLMQILQNKIRDKAEFYSASKRDLSRERTIEAPHDPGADAMPTVEPPSQDLSVTMQVSRGESYTHLRAALEELSPEHRQAITLVFFEGRQLREAGEMMGGRSEDAVRMMLRRAESRLAEILKTSLGKDMRP